MNKQRFKILKNVQESQIANVAKFDP